MVQIDLLNFGILFIIELSLLLSFRNLIKFIYKDTITFSFNNIFKGLLSYIYRIL